MKTLLTLTILTLTTFGCSNKQKPKDEKLTVTETQQKTEKVFKQVADFPTIKDTTQFITELRQTFDLEVHESPVQKENEKITVFKKVKLYGSDKDFIFIEYDWNVGSMAEFPWKYQLLLTTDGKLIKSLSGQRFEFVEIFENKHPFLLITKITAKWNGGHEIYKINSDTLENVYEGYYDYNTRTVVGGEGIYAFEPAELKVNFKDENKDGFNDIVFSGQKLMLGKYTKDGFWYDVENGNPFTIENPADKISINYIFLYDKQTGHFKAKEKYGLDD